MCTIRATGRDSMICCVGPRTCRRRKSPFSPVLLICPWVSHTGGEPQMTLTKLFSTESPFPYGGRERKNSSYNLAARHTSSSRSTYPSTSNVFPPPSKRTMTGQESEWFRGTSQSKRGRRPLGAWGADPRMGTFAEMIRDRNPKAERAKKILPERNIFFLSFYRKSTDDQAKRVGTSQFE